MSRKNNFRGPGGFVISISLGILLGLIISLLVRAYDSVRPFWVLESKLRNEGSYLVYLPDGWVNGVATRSFLRSLQAQMRSR